LEAYTNTPLAERIRPQSIDEYIGQEHLLGKNGVLRKYLKQKVISSMIFWGPPGTGKTTIAELICKSLDRPFYKLSAVESSVKDIRAVIEKAKTKDLFNPEKQPILFIDEIHRFNKSQQDALLLAVEKGLITLIGATTENPSFEVISALLSRCQVYTLEHHTVEDLKKIVKRALHVDEKLNKLKVTIKEEQALLGFSGGDARKLLNLLEMLCATASKSLTITNKLVEQTLQHNMSKYDKAGEQHYDIISAFIKSIRGSDPNATLYWLARMIEGGEDPKFIARRLLISAAEDIGLANPTALVIATNCFKAVEVIGFPESRIILSQAAIYLATSPKSNSAYVAIDKAVALVKSKPNLAVPKHLRNAPTRLMKDLEYGLGYKYSHDYSGNFVKQEFLPEQIKDTQFYYPSQNAREMEIKKYLSAKWDGKYNF